MFIDGVIPRKKIKFEKYYKFAFAEFLLQKLKSAHKLFFEIIENFTHSFSAKIRFEINVTSLFILKMFLDGVKTRKKFQVSKILLICIYFFSSKSV